MEPQALNVTAGVGGAFLLLGVVLLWIARRADLRNWFIQRAPELPLRLVQASDDAWIRGEVICDAPLSIPYFGIPCVHYRYEIEKKVTRTRRTSDGKTETYTTWETEHSERDTARFRIRDDAEELEVRAEEAEFEELESTGTDYEGFSRRHSARYFAPDAEASVVGLVDELRESIGQGEDIPLVVTRRSRKDYCRAIELREKITRVSGMLLVWLGTSVALFAGAGRAGWVPPIGGWRDLVVPGVLAAFAGLVPLSVIWGLYTYNTLVTYRHRTRNAWRLIDIDLKNRYDLVPRLVEVVKGAAGHERGLLERLASLREGYLEGGVRERVEQEGQAVEAVTRVVALGEAYPELGANDLYRHLMDVLEALEEKIAHDRNFYDDNATEYRDIVESFPHLIIARLFGFEAFPLFHIKKDSTRKPAP